MVDRKVGEMLVGWKEEGQWVRLGKGGGDEGQRDDRVSRSGTR